jgi:L-talarate/galactarate dehydratase
MALREGRMWLSDRPGLGFSLSEQALAWTRETAEFGKHP